MFRVTAALVVPLAIFAVSCAAAPLSDDPAASPAPSTSSVKPAPTIPATAPPTAPQKPDTTTSTTRAPTQTTTDSTTELVPGPPSASTWMVVGVTFDDVLNIRAAPGATSAVIGDLAPTEAGVTSTGEAVAVKGSTWWEIESAGTCGWVNARFLAAQGSTTDITSLVVELGADLPAAASMEELARLVIGLRWGDGEQLVIVADAGPDDLTDIAVDVLPEDMDDSVRGQRLRIFGQRDGGEGPYSLYGVEATSLCWRGADELGQCV